METILPNVGLQYLPQQNIIFEYWAFYAGLCHFMPVLCTVVILINLVVTLVTLGKNHKINPINLKKSKNLKQNLKMKNINKNAVLLVCYLWILYSNQIC